MPFVTLADGAQIHYRDDNFCDPWRSPETVVLMHGYCRNSNFWYAWIPVLARHFRVISPDLRGCGRSSVPPEGFAWSLAQYHDDLIAFLDRAGIARAHFVGESMGGMVMPYIYSRSPSRIQSVVACSSNLGVRGVMAKEMAAGAASMSDAIKGAPDLVTYIRRTEASRLAPDEVGAAAREWYAKEWAGTARRVWHEWSDMIVPQIDVTAELLNNLTVPLLFIAASRTVKLPLEEARFWTTHAPDATLKIVDSASQGLAFAKADACAQIALAFLLGKFPAG
jgi:pimeloyl-ACP methyl ester carboxylesterase